MAVLGTKVHVPRPRRDLVPRTRLTERLPSDEGRLPKLVVVAAPAGFGKTTLLTQWVQALQPQVAVAWLSLDASDDDAGRFLTHLVAAVQVSSAAGSATGGDAMALLGEAGPSATQAALVSLVNDLDASAGTTVVVLDDFHVIGASAVHEAVTFLIDNLPPQVSVALTTRVDPPLALSRLRARGELVEIRAGDLRFTDEEAGAFLNGVMGLRLTPRHVAALGVRTEGWVAGLQLAALSAAGRQGSASDVDAFVDNFTGSHRFVLDYLVSEVLDHQPAEVSEFLVDTCVLDELSGDLCDAVTGRTGGQEALERLERANLFLVPLDDERRWWRYHHLFADALRARLISQDPTRARAGHRRAAAWYAERGRLADAVRHSTAGGDHDRTAVLVELALGDLRRRREDRTIYAWLTPLPADVVRSRPLLATFLGGSRLAEGDVAGAETWFDAAEAGLATEQPAVQPGTDDLARAALDRERELSRLPATIAVYRAAVAQAHADVDGTVRHARRALDLAGRDDHLPRASAQGFLGLAAWAAGDLTAAVATFSQAVASLHQAGMLTDELGATVVLGELWTGLGRPDEARRLYQRALVEADRRLPVALAVLGDLHVGFAETLREAGDLDGAEAQLEAARQLGDRASLLENRHRWYTVAAAVRRARGELDDALALLDQAEALYLPGYFPDVRPVAATRARLQISQGRLDLASEWAEQLDVATAGGPTFLEEYGRLTFVRLLVAKGDPAQGLTLLDPVVEGARDAGRVASLLDALVARALALRAAGDLSAASAELGTALTLGVPAGFCRPFLDEGPPMAELLDRVARGTPSAARPHAQALLSLAQRPAAPPTSPGSATSLSDREVEVLRLLATDLSGPEIAQQLFVSVNTLRTHTKHIFTKLDVTTRRAAVRRAADAGLLH